MIELLVEDESGAFIYLDLNVESPIVFNKKYFDLLNIESKHGDFSRRFDLPRTKKNDEFFGLYGDLSNGAIKWSNLHETKCFLLEDSDVVIKGVLRLEEAFSNHDAYVVSINGFVYDLKSRLGELLLSDLDLSELKFNVGQITQTWSGSLFSGNMIFPLHDFGFGLGLYRKKDNNNELVDISDSTVEGIILRKTVPAFRLNYLLTKIIEGAGFVLAQDSSWLAEDEVANIYVQADDIEGDIITEEAIRFNSVFDKIWDISTSFARMPMTADGGLWDNELHQFTAFADGDYYFDFAFIGNANDFTGTKTVSVRLMKNSVQHAVWSSEPNVYTVNLQNYKLTLVDGDVIWWEAEADVDAQMLPAQLYNYFHLTKYEGTGTDIVPNIYLQNHKQIDFVREVVGIFNLVLWEENDGELRLDTYKYYTENFGRLKDWTDKVNLLTKVKVKPMNSELRNPINLEYKRAVDILNDAYIDLLDMSFGTFREDRGVPYAQEMQKPFKVFAPMPVIELKSSVSSAEFLELVHAKYYVSRDDIKYKTAGLQLCYYNGLRDLGKTAYIREVEGGSPQSITQYPFFAPYRLTQAQGWRIKSGTLDLNFSWMSPPADIVDAIAVNNIFSRYWKDMLRDRYDEDNKVVEFEAVLTNADIEDFSWADVIRVNLNGTAMNLQVIEVNNYSPNAGGKCNIKAIITWR